MSGKKKLPARTVPGLPALGPQAQRFIEGGEPTTEPDRLADQPPDLLTSQEARDRDVILRKDGRRLRKKQIYFDADLAVRLAVHCARNNLDQSEYVAAVVEADLKRLAV